MYIMSNKGIELLNISVLSITINRIEQMVIQMDGWTDNGQLNLQVLLHFAGDTNKPEQSYHHYALFHQVLN